MKIRIKILFISFLAVCCLSLAATSANAAQLSFESQTQKIVAGQQFKVNLVLNTENEDVNAMEGKIIFPADLLELKEINYDNSEIGFWIEQPEAGQPGTIDFAGVMLGGFQGAKGSIFSAVFQAKTGGSGVFQIGDAQVLLNDGEGTQANLKISPFQFSVPKAGLAVNIRKNNYKKQ